MVGQYFPCIPLFRPLYFIVEAFLKCLKIRRFYSFIVNPIWNWILWSGHYFPCIPLFRSLHFIVEAFLKCLKIRRFYLFIVNPIWNWILFNNKTLKCWLRMMGSSIFIDRTCQFVGFTLGVMT